MTTSGSIVLHGCFIVMEYSLVQVILIYGNNLDMLFEGDEPIIMSLFPTGCADEAPNMFDYNYNGIFSIPDEDDLSTSALTEPYSPTKKLLPVS